MACAGEQGGDELAALGGQAAAYQGGAAPNGTAGWSWLDAFEARQKALATQAAGKGSTFAILHTFFKAMCKYRGHAADLMLVLMLFPFSQF